jgi:trimeric autotransporter adhesin
MPGQPGVAASSPPSLSVTPPSSYALSIDGAFQLGGFVFKDGQPFLHTYGGAANLNLALGHDALSSLTAPGEPSAWSARRNTAVGDQALLSNTEGGFNTALGATSLAGNETGSFNVAIGVLALNSNTSGNHNSAVGYSALAKNTQAGGNSALGAFALYHNTQGILNTACGSVALYANSLGSQNTAAGAYALGSATASYRNIGVGYKAGYNNTSGTDNIWIGSRGTAVAESNTLRIGGATGEGDFELNRVFIAGIRYATVSDTPVFVDSTGQLGTFTSSRRFKEEIEDMGSASEDLYRLRPVTFRYKQPSADGRRPLLYGLIAEEVADVFPNLVTYDREGLPDTVQYHLLDGMLINELQKHRRTIEQQQAMLESQQAELAELRAASLRYGDLEKRLEEQEARLRDDEAKLERQTTGSRRRVRDRTAKAISALHPPPARNAG